MRSAISQNKNATRLGWRFVIGRFDTPYKLFTKSRKTVLNKLWLHHKECDRIRGRQSNSAIRRIRFFKEDSRLA
jgi:hypothetical protein